MTDQTIDPRRVEYLPVQELVPDPRNPKAHDTDTIDQSIGRFGVLDLIVKDERTGKIISGHGRQKVLAQMAQRGEDPPEGVKVNSDGEWLVPVITGWASRTDSEASAALIALNRTTELGGWVDDALLDLLDDLGDTADGLVGVGYSEADIKDLQGKLADLTTMDYGDTPGEGRDYEAEDSEEIDVDGMEFQHTCPSCGFEFNDVPK